MTSTTGRPGCGGRAGLLKATERAVAAIEIVTSSASRSRPKIEFRNGDVTGWLNRSCNRRGKLVFSKYKKNSKLCRVVF